MKCIYCKEETESIDKCTICKNVVCSRCKEINAFGGIYCPVCYDEKMEERLA
jgi:ribosomal protein L34E